MIDKAKHYAAHGTKTSLRYVAFKIGFFDMRDRYDW